MTQYAIYFNQQWVGDHDPDWFLSRVEPSMAVIHDMEAAGVLVFAGGLEEDLSQAFSVDGTGGTTSVTDGPYTETTEFLGGITVIDVPDLETAKMWAARVAEGCGWPQEVRVVKSRPDAAP
ncbi:YciI family protein [Nocardioides xinjiangensis]|uniref:YciI family protein n=1 Tax=Nocardioides xinjiangensis TaxID=2817376 RepID=UPI001B30FB19|nr:YciI family protein [Nocardioides sp. SYSU D00514]